MEIWGTNEQTKVKTDVYKGYPISEEDVPKDSYTWMDSGQTNIFICLPSQTVPSETDVLTCVFVLETNVSSRADLSSESRAYKQFGMCLCLRVMEAG